MLSATQRLPKTYTRYKALSKLQIHHSTLHNAQGWIILTHGVRNLVTLGISCWHKDQMPQDKLVVQCVLSNLCYQ